MTTLVLRLHEDRLPARCAPIHLPLAARSLYVRSGGLAVEGPDQGNWLDAGQAAVLHSETTLINGDEETVLWRWELSAGTQPESGTLPSAPAATSQLKLAETVQLDPGFSWLMRCDRVSFPPGGVALTHVHQGPGIRICLNGEIRIETLGQTHTYPAGEAWFELGHAPVLAPTTEHEPTSFIRCFLLPRQVKGRSSIRYVHSEDAAAAKVQTYRVFAERYIELP